ncbi:Leucine-rich repeat, ribonuclease inhibitor subtype [Artemisia annua]|uniref:Leucine-rich repeat, ribonuclease inhibitor subtype n=1 Tax=Artemisia annua TaxID=35608 RepID=A0A2U1M2V4_ARTAN|nr:Leucine-rich repeat, ribonuclease inhibitor subtype [Artemisia annua]
MESSTANRLRSIKLWPPSHKTRLLLVERIVKSLTTPSLLSRKYGLLSKEEAEEQAKQIDSSAFETANQHFEKEPDSDGASAVQVYAKESSTLIVEAVKKGPSQKGNQETIPESKPEPVTKIQETFFDISGGARAFIEADEAKELLKPLTEPGNKFTKICFSNRSFGLDAAHVAAPILSSINKQLTEVDLSDFIAGRPEAEALEVMTIFSESLKESDLKYLNLSNNALGEKGVRAFGLLLASQGNLEELYLMNDGISEEAAKAVCELIPVGSEGGVTLAEALGTCKNLKKLDLRDNMFGVEAGIALSQSIPVFVNLTEIHLSYLNLEDEGTLVLVNALKNSKSALEVLEMAGNDFTYKSAPALASFITSKKSTLTKLILSENQLKDEGAIVIANAIKDGFDRLTEVDLSTNAIRTAGARVLSQAVVGKSGFKLLNINGNFLSDEGVDNVKEGSLVERLVLD